jgi:uncharacterized protein YegL
MNDLSNAQDVTEINLPGGALARRQLRVIYVIDTSGSMRGDKIQTVNYAMREMIPVIRAIASEQPNADITIQAMIFNDAATWHVQKPTSVAEFEWRDVHANGATQMGSAFQKLSMELATAGVMEIRSLPPLLILLSDGQPTDKIDMGLSSLMSQTLGRKAVRVAIAIGHDADKSTLAQFVANPEIPVFEAHNSASLFNLIRWASTSVVQSVASPLSRAVGNSVVHLSLPSAAPVSEGDSAW